MIDGVSFVQNAKKRFFKFYIGAFECIDPKAAQHLMNAQKEVFLAGRDFFASEADHAGKAAEKLGKRGRD